MELAKDQLLACYEIGVYLHAIEAAFLRLPNGKQKSQLWRVRAGNAITNYVSSVAAEFQDTHHIDANSAAIALKDVSALLMRLTPEQRGEWVQDAVTPFLDAFGERA